MSEKIPTIGKLWLIAMAAINGLGIITNIVSGFTSTPLFFITAALEVGVTLGLVMMVLGKGLPFYIIYTISYIPAAIVIQYINPANNPSSSTFVSIMIQTVVVIVVNLVLTFLSAKNTFKKEK